MRKIGVLRIEGVGGAFQQLMNSDVIPMFIEKYHIRTEYSGGNPTDQLARMVAARGNPQSDVFITDDGPMYRTIEFGLCSKVEGLPTADLIDGALYPNDKAVGFGVLTSGISYNTKYFAEHGWSPPTVVGRPERPTLPRPSGLSASQQHLGSTRSGHARPRPWRRQSANMEPGFAAMKDIAPNVIASRPVQN